MSTHSPGATLPDAPALEHQIDLFYIQDNEIVEYVTIVECKHHAANKVDQPEIQNLAFVKDSVRAHKAIMVTNNGFTSGAKAVAQSQKIALLVINPQLESLQSVEGVSTDQLFDAFRARLQEKSNAYDICVVQRLAPDPNERGTDVVAQLLTDPSVRRIVEDVLENPEARNIAQKLAWENPDIARQVSKFLKRGGW